MVARHAVGRALVLLLAVVACYFEYYFSKLANESPLDISPEGCEMSWMSPHYILHTEFNKTWTPLASRYSLWLYRERGFDDMDTRRGIPVLFIPGNAGSSRQVRSIASSAARQFQQEQAIGKPLDFFTVEFNEDFSAIHPPTLLSQTRYSKQAIRYILSLYPKGTRIILMGHSMGGTVAQLLLSEMSDDELRAVYTMSTPSLLSPVRFDRRSEDIYSQAQRAQTGDVVSTVPLITICGGSTDSQITSEVCALPEQEKPLRRTIMTTSLEGAWTGVGHREMVWCHQVRYLVARSALFIANNPSSDDSVDQILRIRPTPIKPSRALVNISGLPLHYVTDSSKKMIDSIERGVHLFPLSVNQDLRFTIFAQGARLRNFPPGTRLDRSFRALHCSRPHPNIPELSCVELSGDVSLLPRQSWPQRFPIKTGVLDDDYITMFEANIHVGGSSPDDFAAVLLDGQPASGWVVAGLELSDSISTTASLKDTIKPSGITFSLPSWSKTLHTVIRLPRLFSHALLVYRAEASYDGECSAPKLPPIVLHQPSSRESHYHSISHPFFLQSHRVGPFLFPMRDADHVPSLSIYSSGECGITKLTIQIAWRETLSRLGVRYWMGLAMWCVAVVAVLQGIAWYRYDTEGTFLSTMSVATEFASRWMFPIGIFLAFLSSLPLPKEAILGNSGTLVFTPLAFFQWIFANGLVYASQYLLWAITSMLRVMQRVLRMEGSNEELHISKRWIASNLFILLLVATVIPFQVAFMVIFIIQLFLCSSSYHPTTSVKPSSPAVSSSPTPELWRRRDVMHSTNLHFLLLLTWLCIPFAAPILVVWIRTLQTAGYTVPFDGDHNILCIIPWLLLGEATVSGREFIREVIFWKRTITYLLVASISLTALFLGARFPYLVFEIASVATMWIVGTRIRWIRT